MVFPTGRTVTHKTGCLGKYRIVCLRRRGSGQVDSIYVFTVSALFRDCEKGLRARAHPPHGPLFLHPPLWFSSSGSTPLIIKVLCPESSSSLAPILQLSQHEGLKPQMVESRRPPTPALPLHCASLGSRCNIFGFCFFSCFFLGAGGKFCDVK